MHLSSGNVLATGHVVVYYARAAHEFIAGIKCRHRTFKTCNISTHSEEHSDTHAVTYTGIRILNMVYGRCFSYF